MPSPLTILLIIVVGNAVYTCEPDQTMLSIKHLQPSRTLVWPDSYPHVEIASAYDRE